MKTHPSFPSSGTTVRPSRPAVKSFLGCSHCCPAPCLKSGSCSHHWAPHAGNPSTSGSPAPLPSLSGHTGPVLLYRCHATPKLAHPSLPPNLELLLLPLPIPRSITQLLYGPQDFGIHQAPGDFKPSTLCYTDASFPYWNSPSSTKEPLSFPNFLLS